MPMRKLRSWPEVTPKDYRPHVVRVAPLHDVGIAMAETMGEIFYSVGEDTLSCMPRSFAPIMFPGLSQ